MPFFATPQCLLAIMSVSSPEASQHSRCRSGPHEDRNNSLASQEKTDLPSCSPITESTIETALRNVDSRWFLVPQGTGILAIALWELPYQFNGLNVIAIILWVLTICQFLLILALYILRAVKFPIYYLALLSTDTTEVACLASAVVTLTSIVQMLGLLVGDNGWAVAVYALWWICMGSSFLAVVSIPYVFAHVNPPGIAQLLPNSQLPLVAVITAAAAGGSICQIAALSTGLQVPLIMVSYLLLGLAMPLALLLDTLFLARLYNNTKAEKLTGSRPPALSLAYQTLVLVGPWGQCSSALQGLGRAVMDGSFAQYNSGVLLTSQAAPIIGHISIFAGVLSWGHATFWWIFTIISVTKELFRERKTWRTMGFDLAAWSMVFPWVCHMPLFTIDSPVVTNWS
jgi:tellurite resistance protein TehA-like permease